jgi:hypothetical protein
VLLLPGGKLPLNIFEPRYLAMVFEALAGHRMIGMVQPVQPGGFAGDGMPTDDGRPKVHRIGCAGRITSFNETSDGRYLITLTGVCRFRVTGELQVKTPYRQVRADFAPFEADLRAPDPGAEFDRHGFLDALRPYLEHRGLNVDWDTAEAAPQEALINSLAMALPFEPPEKQALLEADTLDARAQALTALLRIEAAASDDDAGPAMQ